MISKNIYFCNNVKFIEIILPVILFFAIIVSAQETVLETEPEIYYAETSKEKLAKEKLLKMQNAISKLLLKDTVTIRGKDEDIAKKEAFEIAKDNAAQHCYAIVKSIQRINDDYYSEETEKTVFSMTSIKQYKILKKTKRKFTFEIITETDTSAITQKLMELYDDQKIQNKILIDSIEIKEQERIMAEDSISNHYVDIIDLMEIAHSEQKDSITLSKDTVINNLNRIKNEIQQDFHKYKTNNETRIRDILIIGLIMAILVMILVIAELRQ